MALKFQPYEGDPGKETRALFGKSIDSIFNAYAAAKSAGNQDKLVSLGLREKYGVDPRSLSPEQLNRGFAGPTPYQAQGPVLPGQAAPTAQPITDQDPLVAALQSYVQKKRMGEVGALKKSQLELNKTQAEIESEMAGAAKKRVETDELLQDQIYVDPDTGRQIRVPRGAKLIPRESKNTKAGDADMNAALNLYETARNGMISGLEKSETGPFVGKIPAITSAQQVAEGGVAAMAPVLKQLFRVSGEGVFTDRDQELLLNMVPTRKDHPEARAAKIANIDNIVKAKLRIKSPTAAGEDIGGAIAPIALTGQKAARLAELRAKAGR